jgi:hypothetical protein
MHCNTPRALRSRAQICIQVIELCKCIDQPVTQRSATLRSWCGCVDQDQEETLAGHCPLGTCRGEIWRHAHESADPLTNDRLRAAVIGGQQLATQRECGHAPVPVAAEQRAALGRQQFRHEQQRGHRRVSRHLSENGQREMHPYSQHSTLVASTDTSGCSLILPLVTLFCRKPWNPPIGPGGGPMNWTLPDIVQEEP